MLQVGGNGFAGALGPDGAHERADGDEGGEQQGQLDRVDSDVAGGLGDEGGAERAGLGERVDAVAEQPACRYGPARGGGLDGTPDAEREADLVARVPT